MNKIHLKRLKRKRKLEGRIECHGNNSPCKIIHPFIVKQPEPVKIIKRSWFRRLIDKVYGYFK